MEHKSDKKRRKAMTNAERQRRYREKLKLNPEKRAAIKKKKVEYYHKNKVLVANMSAREHRIKKRLWKKYNENRRQKQQQLKSQPAMEPSPSSDDDETSQQQDVNSPVTSQSDLAVSPGGSNLSQVSLTTTPKASGNERRGRRVLASNRRAYIKENKSLYRRIAELEMHLEKEKIKTRTLQRRIQRANKAHKNSLTPKSKVRRLLIENKLDKNIPMKSAIAKKLLYHNVLIDALKEKYMSERSLKKKRIMSQFLASKIIKKYHLRVQAAHTIGLTDRKRYQYSKRKSNLKENAIMKSFFERDDISRATSGKKETITKNKIKKQKRYLVDSMKNLYAQFQREYPDMKISYTVFTRQRPFYILKPSEENRDTCQCKLHANMQFMASKLHKLQVIDSKNPHELLLQTVCDKTHVQCNYNSCKDCQYRQVTTAAFDPDENTTWTVWKMRKEERERRNATSEKVSYRVQVMVKETVLGTVGELAAQFHKDMLKFKTHVFNIKAQNAAHRAAIENIQQHEILIHVDFSQNYLCKLAAEVQTYHFGASRAQVTLHTGFMYIPSEEVVSFCSISDDNYHGPSAIWAHMQPILELAKEKRPIATVVHFFSDGPSSQYRQKKNFYMLSTKIFHYGFKSATWNFFEAGHGKGPADGVGAAVKRTADMAVAHGQDISSGHDLYSLFHDTTSKIKVFYIEEDQIQKNEEELQAVTLITIPGTQKMHQIMACKEAQIGYRQLSCLCKSNSWNEGIYCTCFFQVKKVHFGTSNTALDDDPVRHVADAPSKHTLPSCNTSFTMDRDKLKCGTFVLAHVQGTTAQYRYAAICQSDFGDRDEATIMFLKKKESQGRTVFQVLENDIHLCSVRDIIMIIPEPKMVIIRNSIYYEFPSDVDVYEKK